MISCRVLINRKGGKEGKRGEERRGEGSEGEGMRMRENMCVVNVSKVGVCTDPFPPPTPLIK